VSYFRAPFSHSIYNYPMSKQTKAQARKTTIFVAIATFVGLSVITLAGWALTRPDQPKAVTQFERMSIADFKAAYDRKEIVVLDVRPIEAYVASHIPGSLHIPVTRVQGEIPYLPKDKPIVAYCTCPAEESSGEAALILANGGIKAFALTGGLEAWTSAGYPTEAGVK
jgi:rhodanese-related sulfurtransferase